VAAYILVRQGLLALRDQPRRWPLALPVTLTGAVAAPIADILIAAAR
jgi:hypothetical protein